MSRKVSQEENELLIKINDLTNDLQRNRADFENYRKRVEGDLAAATNRGEQKAVLRILPLLDIFDSVFANLPNEFRETDYGRGIILAEKNLMKVCDELNLAKIPVKVGDEFNHEFMNAVQIDENSEGEKEIVAEILQNGYVYGAVILRPAMVKIARQ